MTQPTTEHLISEAANAIEGQMLKIHRAIEAELAVGAPLSSRSKAVYRLMRRDELDHLKGRSPVWVLSMLRAALETQALVRLEARLEVLAPSIEGKTHGYQNNRSAHTSH